MSKAIIAALLCIIVAISFLFYKAQQKASRELWAIWSYNQFLKDAAIQGCLNREAFVRASEDRDWHFEENLPAIYRGSVPDEYDTALTVALDPPLPFRLTASKNDGHTFFFDANGCLLY